MSGLGSPSSSPPHLSLFGDDEDFDFGDDTVVGIAPMETAKEGGKGEAKKEEPQRPRKDSEQLDDFTLEGLDHDEDMDNDDDDFLGLSLNEFDVNVDIGLDEDMEGGEGGEAQPATSAPEQPKQQPFATAAASAPASTIASSAAPAATTTSAAAAAAAASSSMSINAPNRKLSSPPARTPAQTPAETPAETPEADSLSMLDMMWQASADSTEDLRQAALEKEKEDKTRLAREVCIYVLLLATV